MPHGEFLTRRRFLAQTAATAGYLMASTGFAADAASPALSSRRPAFCAFEKPLQFLDYSQVAQLLAEAGFEGVEATVRKGGHVRPEKVTEELPRFVDALAKQKLAMTILTSDIASVEQAHAEKVLRTAAKLGIKYYRLGWYRYDLQKPIAAQLEAIRPQLKGLAALNRELGLTGLYQNHSGANMVGAPIWDIYGLIKELNPKEIALAFDIRHATVEGGLSWPVQFELVKSHVAALYMKDFVWENRQVKSVPFGTGLVDQKFFAQVKTLNFTGPISIHIEYLEHSKDQQVIGKAFQTDLEKVKSWL